MGGIAFSCTTTDDNFSVLNEEREATLNAETSKQQFANDVNAVMSEGKSLHNLSGNQVSQLQKSAIRMLKDEKVYSVDMDKLVEQNNAGIVFVGLMYLSLEKTQIIQMCCPLVLEPKLMMRRRSVFLMKNCKNACFRVLLKHQLLMQLLEY